MKLEIAFIGAGNVAWHLAHAMDKAGHSISQIISRTEESAKELAVNFGAHFSTNLNSLYAKNDVCLICVPDDQLEMVLEKMPPVNAILAHTCGPKPMEMLYQKSSVYGIFYPLQTFSKHRELNMLEVPVMIEASSPIAHQTLFSLADDISNRVMNVNSEDRRKYHLSAVFTNNFVNYLYSLSDQYLEMNQLDFEVLKPIILETAEKIRSMKPEDAQTGPARRGDIHTLEKHIEMLGENSELKEVYELLSKSLIAKYKR